MRLNRLSPPFVAYSGELLDDWDFQIMTYRIPTLERAEVPSDPWTNPTGLSRDAWKNFLIEYSVPPLVRDQPTTLMFQAPTNGMIGSIERNGSWLFIFKPWDWTPFTLRVDDKLPQRRPFGNVFVFTFPDISKKDVDFLIKRLLYNRIVHHHDPIRYLKTNNEGETTVDELFNDIDDFDSLTDIDAQSYSSDLLRYEEEGRFLLPITSGTVLPIQSLPRPYSEDLFIDIAFAYVPPTNERINPETHWAWADADSILKHLNNNGVFFPPIEFSEGNTRPQITMWYENDDRSPTSTEEGRVFKAVTGQRVLYEPPVHTLVSADILPVLDGTTSTFYSTEETKWEWELRKRIDDEVLLDSPARTDNIDTFEFEMLSSVPEGIFDSKVRIKISEERWTEYEYLPRPTDYCRNYIPSDITNIVLDATEYDPPVPFEPQDDQPIYNFRNWGAARGAPGAGRGVWHYDWGEADGHPKPNCRMTNTITSIVLHETGVDNTPPDGPRGFIQRKTGAHFMILRDGRIVQFTDIVDEVRHGNLWNSSSVGIEFANQPLTNGDGLELHWAVERARVPPLEAVESLARLVSWLINDPRLHIPPVWLNLQSVPGTAEAAWLVHWRPPRGGPESNPLHPPQPGIISHNIYRHNREDGWFQALYTWLRLQYFDGAGMSENEAYDKAIEIITSPPEKIRRVNSGRFIVLDRP